MNVYLSIGIICKPLANAMDITRFMDITQRRHILANVTSDIFTVMFTAFSILINLICSICCQTLRMISTTHQHISRSLKPSITFHVNRERKEKKSNVCCKIYTLLHHLWIYLFFTCGSRYDRIDNTNKAITESRQVLEIYVYWQTILKFSRISAKMSEFTFI